MDLSALRAALTPRSRAVLVVHPNNPTGSFVMPKEATELHAICAEREMAIVADEVFLDYSAESKPHSTFAFDNAALAFTLSGLSKISALPQMKLAWLVASGPQTARSTRDGTPGNYCRHISFARHTSTARSTKTSRHPRRNSAPTTKQNYREPLASGFRAHRKQT